MSFDIFLIRCGVKNFLPELVHMLLFSTEKTEFPFFEFPYFWVLQNWAHWCQKFPACQNEFQLSRELDELKAEYVYPDDIVGLP